MPVLLKCLPVLSLSDQGQDFYHNPPLKSKKILMDRSVNRGIPPKTIDKCPEQYVYPG
jgi:hypothetical protein